MGLTGCRRCEMIKFWAQPWGRKLGWLFGAEAVSSIHALAKTGREAFRFLQSSMILTRLTLRISFILALLGLVLGIIGAGLVGVSIYLNLNGSQPAEALAEEADCQEAEACATQYTL